MTTRSAYGTSPSTVTSTPALSERTTRTGACSRTRSPRCAARAFATPWLPPAIRAIGSGCTLATQSSSPWAEGRSSCAAQLMAARAARGRSTTSRSARASSRSVGRSLAAPCSRRARTPRRARSPWPGCRVTVPATTRVCLRGRKPPAPARRARGARVGRVPDRPRGSFRLRRPV